MCVLKQNLSEMSKTADKVFRLNIYSKKGEQQHMTSSKLAFKNDCNF